MAMEVGNTLSIKLLLDNHGKRVLFAEAGKDFVDFLFHIMMLPVGTLIKLIKPNSMGGCVGNLYTSIQNIGDMFLESPANKEALLNPMSLSCGATIPLLLNVASPTASKKYYKCYSCYSSPSIADHPDARCTYCASPMTKEAVMLEKNPMKTGASSSSGYVKEVVTYMVMDDLEVKPMSTISSITVLKHFKVKDVQSLEEKVVAIGMNEAVELLKISLRSKTVLTDLFFGKV